MRRERRVLRLDLFDDALQPSGEGCAGEFRENVLTVGVKPMILRRHDGDS